MPQFHPIIYCSPSGGANSITVEANDADEACCIATSQLLDISRSEAEEMIKRRQIEVIAVIKGDPQFEQTKQMPLFPGF